MRTSPFLCAATTAILVAVVAAPPVCSAATWTEIGNGLENYAYAINNSGQVAGESIFFNESRAFIYSAGTTTDIGNLGGSPHGAAPTAINDAGQVVGVAGIAGDFDRAFLYSGGVMADLGTLGGDESNALAINESGQVAGWAQVAGGKQHAFRYSGGIMTDLGTLGGDESNAVAINDSGQVVGWAEVPGGNRHAFLYSGGVMTDLGTLGGSDSEAAAINDSGQAVGWARTSGGDRHAFLYSGGVMTDLGTLGGTDSAAVAINGSGQIAGSSTMPDGHTHPFLHAAGITRDLGTTGNWINCSAVGMNEAGQVIGSCYADGGIPFHPFLYSRGRMTDLLPSPGINYASAQAINDSGEIAGWEIAAYFGYALVREVVCGDEILDLLEECDGGCCRVDCTDPRGSCLTGAASSLVIKNSDDDAKDQLVWKWNGAGPVDPADLGDPTDDTSYTLCVFDSAQELPVATLPIDPPTDPYLYWSNTSTGLRYKDPDGLVSGVTKVQIRAGENGRVELRARGAQLPMPTPFSPGALFEQEPEVTVELFNGDVCWISEFTGAKSNTSSLFKATTP